MRLISFRYSVAVLSLGLPALLCPPAGLAQLEGDTAPPQQLAKPHPAANTPTSTALPVPNGKKRLSKEFTVQGGSAWLDTGIDLQPGEHVLITAKGTLRYADAKEENGPDGLSRGFKDLLRILPFNGAGRGSLIARIGDADTAQPFLIGASRDAVAPTAGRLSLGINQSKTDTGEGSYSVHVDIYATDGSAGAMRAIAKSVASLPGVDNALFTRIPRRIADKDGNAGDMVNFIILGSEAAVQRVFTTAGWVKVDSDVKDTVLHGLIGSLSKESYLTMPMSQLYLFGRPQDYGWAHAEPISVVASRNHLRLWKAPFTVNGGAAWVGAATHDIGFERDQRNNGITHKIDPDIDLERDYVEKTLLSTGLVAEVSHFLPENPMKEAKTATGGTFHSNGQVLILKLVDSGKDLSAAFAESFCSVLQNENPDGGEWGPCSQYIQSAPTNSAASTSTRSNSLSNYRVLVVPGVLSSCQANTEAFGEAQTHLREKHGMTVEFLQTPNESSNANGQRIATYLREKTQGDSRKYILVGYSKGTPDIQEALANDPQTRNAVAAFISVAGASGGSPIAGAMPSIVQQYTATLKLGTCQGDVAEAFQSLRQDVRKRFLADHPDPLVPTFSLAAVSDAATTSKMLREAWKLLTAYDSNTDSQLLLSDAIVPGGNFFGTLHADHLAVALNYLSSNDSTIRAAADRNRYPRSALLEAAVRSAIAALDSQPNP